jgi:hypothetical protein
MSRVYIKFASDPDRIRGVYALATQASVDSLPEEIFGISAEDLYILKNEKIKYTEATRAEVDNSYRKLRTFWNEKPAGRRKSKRKIRQLAQTSSTHLKP